jgi:hypothetical protein
VFVCTKNHAGRDAATEARAAGHDDLAAFLDGLAQRLDHADMRTDEAYIEDARQASLECHWYYDKRERDSSKPNIDLFSLNS